MLFGQILVGPLQEKLPVGFGFQQNRQRCADVVIFPIGILPVLTVQHPAVILNNQTIIGFDVIHQLVQNKQIVFQITEWPARLMQDIFRQTLRTARADQQSAASGQFGATAGNGVHRALGIRICAGNTHHGNVSKTHYMFLLFQTAFALFTTPCCRFLSNGTRHPRLRAA